MTKHQPFVLVAEMLGPIVLRNPIHLDGILLAAREKRDGFSARGTPFATLARRDGVFQATAGVLVTAGIGGVIDDTVTRTRRLDMKRCGRNIAIDPATPKPERTITQMSPYRPTMETERVLGNVKSVSWQGVGDIAEIEELCSYVMSIGKQHATGWGEVDHFKIHECGASAETCGLAAGGRALRNLPVDMLAALGIASDIVFKGRLEPPYATRDGLHDVTGPALKDLTMSEVEARRLLSY
jgi:hypothetical protein